MTLHYLSALPATADLVIVGGGVVGAATAFHAARAGLRTLLLERRPRLCTLTTPASTGAFRLQFDNQEELALVRESVELFLHFEEITQQREYRLGIRQQGYLWCTTSPATAERQRRLVEAQHGWGQTDIELLDGAEVRHRFPYVSQDVVQARFRAEDGFLDPKQLTLGLAHASGADVMTSCAVTGFQVRDGRLAAVETSRGTVSTRTAVMAPGPFLGPLATTAGIDLPVTTVRRQKLVVPDIPEVPPGAPMTIEEDTGAHWRPALRSGAFVLFTDPTTPASEPADDVPLDHAFAFALLDPASPVSVAAISPFWHAVWDRSATLWLLQAGQYTMTPDHRPLIGQTPIEGLWVNGGYSGHGIMGSAAGSRVLIDVLSGRIAQGSNPLSPDRPFAHRSMDIL